MTTNEHIAATFVETDNFKFHHECEEEIKRLRKWQQEALPYLHREIEQCKIVLGIGICECEECAAAKIRGKQLNRLITEAQED